MSRPKVDVRNLTKRFRTYRRAQGRLIEWLTFNRKRCHTIFTALEDISFSMRSGEFFGVIGPNGSGKSTLLKILTQVLWPTSGTFRIDGRVMSLLELGTGFNPELTGRENILHSARLLGFTPGYVQSRIDEMIAFADIGHYVDQPIKYYSSGMLVRLAFAIFAHVEPDVFIVDEALSVGDVYFSQKCFQRLDQMRAAGCTLLFVSHDLAAVRKYCDQVLYLHSGRCRFLGSALDATDMYLEAMSPGGVAHALAPQTGDDAATVDPQQLETELHNLHRQLPDGVAAHFDGHALAQVLAFRGGRIGTGAVRLAAVSVRSDAGEPRERFTLNDRIHIHALARVHEDIASATVGIQVTNQMGITVWGTNHERLSGQTLQLRSGTWVHTVFTLEPGLGPGEYTIDVGWGDASGQGHVFDRLTGIGHLEIAPEGGRDFMGLARIPCHCDVTSH